MGLLDDSLKVHSERKRIKSFKEETERRIEELEGQDVRTKAEGYELDMCRYDVRRAKIYLGEKVEEKKSFIMEKRLYMSSMSVGCKILPDVCSVCGNKASTPDEYCVHLKGKGKIDGI